MANVKVRWYKAIALIVLLTGCEASIKIAPPSNLHRHYVPSTHHAGTTTKPGGNGGILSYETDGSVVVTKAWFKHYQQMCAKYGPAKGGWHKLYDGGYMVSHEITDHFAEMLREH
jgi:hypothetical protein